MGSIFKIGTRLAFGFLAILVILVAIVWFSIIKMKLLSEQTENLYAHPFIVSTTTERIQTNMIKMHRTMKDIALSADITKSAEDIAKVDELERKIFEDFKIINKELPDVTADEKALKLFTDWKIIRDEVISDIQKGKIESASAITKGKGARQVAAIEREIDALSGKAALDAQSFMRKAHEIRQDTMSKMYALLGGSILFALFLSMYITRSIASPIESIKSAMEDFGKGNLDSKIIVDSRDELGKLAEEFNLMALNLSKITASRDELNREIAKREEFEEIIKGNNERLQMLWDLSQDSEAKENEFLSRAVEAAVNLTKSEVGYMHLFDEELDEIILKMWSRKTVDGCSASAESHYPLESAGIWADSVRNRMPVIHNDYLHMADRHGYPEGHFPVIRHMSVPVIDNERIVAVAGVGNKHEPYAEKDVEQLQLFMNNLWLLIVNKRAEAQLKTMLEEKELLFKEMNHRVKNNMAIIASLLSMQSKYLTDEKALGMFRESQSRIRSMALVHEKLYQKKDGVDIDIKSYVSDLFRSIKNTFAVASHMKVNIDVQNVDLDLDALIPCGLIINELMTNALKYAFDGNENPEINVSLKKNGDGYAVLKVWDNGGGLPEGFDISQSKGLGMQIVTTLSEQINGRLEVSGTGGAMFTLTFPEKKEFSVS